MGKHYGLWDRKEEAGAKGEITQRVLELLAGMHGTPDEGER